VNCGFGIRIPEGVLKKGHLYDAEVLVAGIEEGGGRIGCFTVAGYGGEEKEDINCVGGEYVIATPAIGYFETVRVRFTAGDENIIYVIVSAHNLGEGQKVGVVVDRLRIWDLGEVVPDKYKTYYGFAKEIMVLGEYLSIYGKGDGK